jgi:hypothetical protein
MKTSKERKETPVFSGVLQYFPDAINAVARQSWAGNEKHNPGEPLHWSREKSSDHMDCAIRHMMTPDEIDPETGGTHLVAAAWRVLAALQLQCEAIAHEQNLEDLGVPIEEAFDLSPDFTIVRYVPYSDRSFFGVGDRVFSDSGREGVVKNVSLTGAVGQYKYTITATPVETTP